MRVILPSIILREEPDFSSETSSELLYGETVEVLSEENGFFEIINDADDYRGFLPIDALSDEPQAPTHKIKALQTYAYAAPSFKSPPTALLPFIAKLTISGEAQDGFIMANGLGWIWKDHLCPLDAYEPDFVKTALRFLDRPYLWGGKTAAGIDCSGLVQLSMQAAGLYSPRDTKDQIETLGEAVEPDAPLQRGDLVYFPRHVGIMLDEKNILNATSRTMNTLVEKIDDLKKIYEGILAARRIP